MLEMNPLSSADTAATFSLYQRREKTARDKEGTFSQTQQTNTKKRQSNFDAQQALRKVAMAETKQALRGVMSALRGQALRSKQYEDGDVMAAKVKSILRKARFKMKKLTQEQQLIKERDAAKRENRLKLQSKLHETLQHRRLNRRMREWNDVKGALPNTRFDAQTLELPQQTTVDITSAAITVVPQVDAATVETVGSVDIIV